MREVERERESVSQSKNKRKETNRDFENESTPTFVIGDAAAVVDGLEFDAVVSILGHVPDHVEGRQHRLLSVWLARERRPIRARGSEEGEKMQGKQHSSFKFEDKTGAEGRRRFHFQRAVNT